MARFIHRYGTALFFAYMVVGLLFLLLIESVFNGGFWQSTKWLSLPVAGAIFGFTWVNREFLYRQTRSRHEPWVTSLLLYPLAVLFIWPYVMALNAATAMGDVITYSGPIVQKWIQHSGRGGATCQIDVGDTRSAQTVTVTVPREKYASLSEGDVFTSGVHARRSWPPISVAVLQALTRRCS